MIKTTSWVAALGLCLVLVTSAAAQPRVQVDGALGAEGEGPAVTSSRRIGVTQRTREIVYLVPVVAQDGSLAWELRVGGVEGTPLDEELHGSVLSEELATQDDPEAPGARVTVEGVLHPTGKILVGERVYRLTGRVHEKLEHLFGVPARFEGRALPGAIQRRDGLREQRLVLSLVEVLEERPLYTDRLEGYIGYVLSERESMWMHQLERDLFRDGEGLTREELAELGEDYDDLWESERWKLWVALECRGGVFKSVRDALQRPPRNSEERLEQKQKPKAADWEAYLASGGLEERDEPELEADAPEAPSRRGAIGALDDDS